MEFLESHDQGIVNGFFHLAEQTPKLKETVIFVTNLGNPPFLYGVVLGAIFVLVAQRHYFTGLMVGLTLLGATGLVDGTKALVKRPRPNLVTVPDSYSFPSGHALLSAAVYSGLALAGAPLIPRQRARLVVLGIALLLGFLIGLSRLYLCQHYLTDVLAGWSAGWAWALLCHALDVRWTRPRAP
jgi:undecaprenyl-diphosphatase